jgi:hypothetical protein
MILFALSRIHFWHQSTTVGWPGWLFPAPSFGLTTAMILSFFWSP